MRGVPARVQPYFGVLAILTMMQGHGVLDSGRGGRPRSSYSCWADFLPTFQGARNRVSSFSPETPALGRSPPSTLLAPPPQRRSPVSASTPVWVPCGRGLSKTRGGFVSRLRGLLTGRATIDDATVEQIEEVLFTADLGVRTSERLIEAIRSRLGPRCRWPTRGHVRSFSLPNVERC